MEYIIMAVIFGGVIGLCVGSGAFYFLDHKIIVGQEKLIDAQDRKIDTLNKIVENDKRIIGNDELIIKLKDELISRLDAKIEQQDKLLSTPLSTVGSAESCELFTRF